MLALARMQWRRFKRTWATAQDRAVGRGIFLGPAQFGYLANGGPLAVDPIAGPLVSEAFRIAAAEDLHAAVRYLNGAYPGRVFRTKEVRRMLENRVYLGEVNFGELTNPEAHEALTTVARFEAARTPAKRRRSADTYPLSGVAVCGECGAAIIGSLQTVKGHRYRRYRCAARTHPCGIDGPRMEAVVHSEISRALADWALRLVGPGSSDLGEAREAMEMAESHRDRWANDDFARDRMGEAKWRAGLIERESRYEEAREGYQLLASQSARSEVLPAADELDNPEQFARALRAMVDRIEVQPGRAPITERVSIKWVGAA